MDIKLRIKHHRNALTHYRAWETLCNIMMGNFWHTLSQKQKLSVRLWEYVCRYVLAPAVDELSPNGGMTEVTLIIDGIEYYAISHCSILDRYINQVGVNVAVKHMLKDNISAPRVHRVMMGSLIHGRVA